MFLPKLAAAWDRIRTSLWFLPTLMLLASVLLAWLAVQVSLDAQTSVWWLNQGSAEEAGRLLSALLGSLITMATLAISITMVVLTLAAGQLGPRLIRSFAGDRRTQGVLGLFIATVIYILLIFRLLDSDLPKEAVPHFAVTLASVLIFVCLVALVFYVHHLSRSIVSDTVINRVGDDLDRAIRQNIPERNHLPELFQHRSDEPPAPFAMTQSGYVQLLDLPGLTKAAAEREALVELLVRPGHHVLAGRTHALVWPASALDRDLCAALASAVTLGPERTPVQDIEFSLRQLVEVALRALSPGINDPFTAIAAINRLSASLALAIERGEPQNIWRDSEGKVRVVTATTTFGGLVDLSFNQIRQAGAAHPDVLIRLVEVLDDLDRGAVRVEQTGVLQRYLDAVMETARLSIRHSADLAALGARYEAGKRGDR